MIALNSLNEKIDWVKDFIERWEKADEYKSDIDPLCKELEEFCEVNEVPFLSADELLLVLLECRPHQMDISLNYGEGCKPQLASVDEKGLIDGDPNHLLDWEDFIFNEDHLPSYQVTFQGTPECGATEIETGA